MRSGLVVVSVTAGGRFINIWPSELVFLTRSISNNWVGGGQGGPSNGEGGDQSDTYWVGAGWPEYESFVGAGAVENEDDRSSGLTMFDNNMSSSEFLILSVGPS